MFKNKEYNFFNNIYIPAIILILLYLFGNKGEIYFKAAITIGIPIGATIYLFKKISVLKLEKKKIRNILILTFIFELIFSIQIMFFGIPIIPYLPASFWRKKEYDKGLIKLILIILWSLIFLYQISINLIKIKEMW